MTDAEKAVLVETLARALEPLHNDIRDLQADVSLALERLDRLDGIEDTVRDIKAHNVKLSREGVKDRAARQSIERRLSALELRLESLERKGS